MTHLDILKRYRLWAILISIPFILVDWSDMFPYVRENAGDTAFTLAVLIHLLILTVKAVKE